MRPINRKFCGLLTANYSTRIIHKTTVRLSTASDGERPDHGKGRKQGTIGIKQRFESIMENKSRVEILKADKGNGPSCSPYTQDSEEATSSISVGMSWNFIKGDTTFASQYRRRGTMYASPLQKRL